MRVTNIKADLRERRYFGTAVGLVAAAAVGLMVAVVAVGEEVLTLPEARQEAADIAARLPGLREERDSLVAKIAELRASLAEARVDEQRLTRELPSLRSEESRRRAERDSLADEVATLTDNRSALAADVNRLKATAEDARSEADGALSRADDARSRAEGLSVQLDDLRRSLAEERRKLVRTKEEVSAKLGDLDQVESDMDNADRLLTTKRAELRELTAEAATVAARLSGLKGSEASARQQIRQLADQLRSLDERLASDRSSS